MRLDKNVEAEKLLLFNEILNRPMKLMNDVFGNYVVQIMLDQCTFE